MADETFDQAQNALSFNNVNNNSNDASQPTQEQSTQQYPTQSSDPTRVYPTFPAQQNAPQQGSVAPQQNQTQPQQPVQPSAPQNAPYYSAQGQPAAPQSNPYIQQGPMVVPAYDPTRIVPAGNTSAVPTQTIPPVDNASAATNPAQQPSSVPGSPMYVANHNAANPFADPANASGTRASVTAHGASQYASTQQKKKTTIAAVWSAVAAGVLAALLVFGMTVAAISSGWIKVPGSGSATSVIDAPDTSSSSSGSANWVAVAKKVSPAVVLIRGQVSEGTVTGSGAIISQDGYIITNNHVVDGASNLSVTMSDGKIYSAKIIGTDPSTDLAVIQMEDAPSDLTVVEFANSDNLSVGQQVMAIGSPLGYQNTVTSGIISALNRPVTVQQSDNTVVATNAIQIDASINQGNSGGPTFNTEGQLIGINSSIATASTTSGGSSLGSVGIGFAIPSNLAKWVANSLMQDGSVTHVELGITARTVEVTSQNGTQTGAQIASVKSDSAAQKAGLREGDVIIGYNGKTVNSINQLLGYIRAAQEGEEATLTVVRNNSTTQVVVTLDSAETKADTPETNDNSSNNNSQNNNNGNNSNESWEDLLKRYLEQQGNND